MMRCFLRAFGLLFALLATAPAWAISCTQVTTTGVSFTYYNRTAAVAQGTITVTCSRTVGEAANSVTYSVAADDGANATNKGLRQIALGNSRIRYELYTDSSCSTRWDSSTFISETITWNGNKGGAQSRTTSFWACAAATNVAGAGGTYTDTVIMTVSHPGGTNITGNLPVSVFAPANCSFSTNPNSLTLNYVAFGPAVSASSNFAVQCTDGMPYTIAPNVPNGVLSNILYNLAVSNSSSTGTGLPQTFTVTATAPGGQSGACATATCSATQAHTIVVTY